jgi:hypothetical protein
MLLDRLPLGEAESGDEGVLEELGDGEILSIFRIL